MNTAIILSPHLDDAAFSLGPVLANDSKSVNFVVATVFTQSVYRLSDFALACQLDKGLSASDDYMALRRAEDKEWSETLGLEIIHGDFPEAPHRGYASVKALFGPALNEHNLRHEISQWVLDLILSLKPSAILCPMGIGNHIDHITIKEIVQHLSVIENKLYFFKDLPYAKDCNILSVEGYLNKKPYFEHTIDLSETCIELACAATQAYKTQVPFQFGSHELMKEKLKNSWGKKLTIYSLHNQPLDLTQHKL